MPVRIELKIKSFSKKLADASMKANRQNAATVVREVKNLVAKSGTSSGGEAPRSDSGSYKFSIQVFRTTLSSGKIVTSVGSSNRIQAISLEYGTHKMRARPHWRPTISKLKNTLRNEYIQIVRRAIGN